MIIKNVYHVSDSKFDKFDFGCGNAGPFMMFSSKPISMDYAEEGYVYLCDLEVNNITEIDSGGMCWADDLLESATYFATGRSMRWIEKCDLEALYKNPEAKLFRELRRYISDDELVDMINHSEDNLGNIFLDLMCYDNLAKYDCVVIKNIYEGDRDNKLVDDYIVSDSVNIKIKDVRPFSEYKTDIDFGNKIYEVKSILNKILREQLMKIKC